ncbi:MAG: methionine ABC transporter substrate-binding protein [Simkania sp.]|nr:methionine ABC transporter substrate-binding protein [Simkania sp.]
MHTFITSLCAIALCLAACTSPRHELKVAATPTPQAEILKFVKDDLKKEGIDLKIIKVYDYNIPNQSLANKEIDANYFQHEAFLENQEAQFHYCLVPLAKVHIEPLGLYSKTLTSLNDLPDGSKVAIPSDPTNEARALRLLAKEGLITLNQDATNQISLFSIETNPKHLQFFVIDASILPMFLDDVALAAIPTNYALQAKLSPENDALAKEDASSPYTNELVVRCGDESREDLLKLKAALTSAKTRAYILEHFHGEILPAF